MLKNMFPVGADLFVKHAFKAAKEFPNECLKVRLDIDKRVAEAIAEWKAGE